MRLGLLPVCRRAALCVVGIVGNSMNVVVMATSSS